MSNTDILEAHFKEISDILETYELLDLQEVERVLGSDTFIDLFRTISDNLETQERLKVLGSMDKLLNSNKSDSIKYTKGTVFREEQPNKVKNEFEYFIFESCIEDAIEDILYNLPNTGETILMNRLLEIILLGTEESYFDDENYSEEIINYIKNNRDKLPKMLNNLKIIDESVEEGYYLDVNFYKEDTPTNTELLDIIKIINF